MYIYIYMYIFKQSNYKTAAVTPKTDNIIETNIIK